jgi:branched-chain amino acid transport system permease protein
MQMTELILQALYSGLLQGGSYALIALGLALVFGTMRVINLAHGELVLLAAYIAYTVESGLGLNPAWAIPIALVDRQRDVGRRVRHRQPDQERTAKSIR